MNWNRVGLFVCIILGLLLQSCGFSGGKTVEKPKDGKPSIGMGKPEKPKFKIPVIVQKIKRDRMYAYLQAVGTVVPVKEVEIKPEMTARIYFTKRWMEGDEVKKGDKLAAMDDRQLNFDINQAELDLELAKSAVRPASAQLAQAFKDEEFKKAMYERGAISKAEYDQAILARIQRENMSEQTFSNIETRTMALKKLKQEQEKVSIIIPFDGVLLPAKQSVVNTQRESGESDLTLMNGLMVGASTVLCRLANIDKVFVALDVPAKDLLQVKVGQNVELDIYSRVGHSYKGVVQDISTSLNANTRTYTVNVLVDNPEHELRPGMFAKARIVTDEKLDAVSVPRELVLIRNNRPVVLVVKEKPNPDEVQSATGEIRTDSSDRPRRGPQLAMAGTLEKVAAASEKTDAATEEAALDPVVEKEEKDMIAEEREVTLGIENRERIQITEGLQQGDLLVVLGYETLSNGVDVNVTIRDEDLPIVQDAAASSNTPSQK